MRLTDGFKIYFNYSLHKYLLHEKNGSAFYTLACCETYFFSANFHQKHSCSKSRHVTFEGVVLNEQGDEFAKVPWWK